VWEATIIITDVSPSLWKAALSVQRSSSVASHRKYRKGGKMAENFKIGDSVQMRNGVDKNNNPVMVISSIVGDSRAPRPELRIVCYWFNVNGELQIGSFPSELIQPIH
jgi:uncharacterized protein YodC (DUF2158 family)